MFSSGILLIITLAQSYEIAKWVVGILSPFILLYLKNYLDSLKAKADKADRERAEAKKEIDDICERLERVEEVDRTAYPEFQRMKTEVTTLKETVTNHHEHRLQGLSTANERLGENFDLKLANAMQRVDGLEKRLDRIDSKLDKILDKMS